MERPLEKCERVTLYTMTVLAVLMVLYIAIISANAYFFRPLAGEVANKICQDNGFDQSKSYETVIFSSMPLDVKCEYAPRSTQVEPQQ